MAQRFVRTKRDGLKKGMEILFGEINRDLMGGVTLSWIYGSIVARWGVYPDKKQLQRRLQKLKREGKIQNSGKLWFPAPPRSAMRSTSLYL